MLLAVVAAAVALSQSLAAAQQQPPPPTDAAKTDWELARMIAVAQEARDYVQRRREQLGSLPSDVQPLVAQGQEHLQQLRQAVEQRDIARARSVFRLALVLFEEIRLRLNEVMDAQDTATTTPERAAAKLAQSVRRLRERWTELKLLAAQSPLATIEAELARVDELIRALEQRPASAAPASLRQQVLDARGALKLVETAIAGRVEVVP